LTHQELAEALARVRAAGRRRLGDAYDQFFFDELAEMERLAERGFAFMASHPEPASTGDGTATPKPRTTVIVDEGIERLKARNRFLTRRENLQLAMRAAYFLLVVGLAVAIWMLLLHGDPSGALHGAGAAVKALAAG
jgi:hypothetical protein